LQAYPQNFTEGLSPLWKSPPRKPYFTLERIRILPILKTFTVWFGWNFV